MRLTVILLLTFLLTTLAQAGTWVDDFDDNNDDGWDRWGNHAPNPIGKWELVDGQYVITVTSLYAASIWGDLKWDAYTVKVHARSINGLGCLGIVVRAQDPRNFYAWALDAPSNTLSWWQDVNGNISSMTQDPAHEDRLKEHLYKVVVSGDGFEGYYDGKLIRKWQSKLLKTGRVGIGTGCINGEQATFDDFVITGDGVPDSERAVTPRGKLATLWGQLKGR